MLTQTHTKMIKLSEIPVVVWYTLLGTRRAGRVDKVGDDTSSGFWAPPLMPEFASALPSLSRTKKNITPSDPAGTLCVVQILPRTFQGGQCSLLIFVLSNFENAEQRYGNVFPPKISSFRPFVVCGTKRPNCAPLMTAAVIKGNCHSQ